MIPNRRPHHDQIVANIRVNLPFLTSGIPQFDLERSVLIDLKCMSEKSGFRSYSQHYLDTVLWRSEVLEKISRQRILQEEPFWIDPDVVAPTLLMKMVWDEERNKTTVFVVNCCSRLPSIWRVFQPMTHRHAAIGCLLLFYLCWAWETMLTTKRCNSYLFSSHSPLLIRSKSNTVLYLPLRLTRMHQRLKKHTIVTLIQISD